MKGDVDMSATTSETGGGEPGGGGAGFSDAELSKIIEQGTEVEVFTVDKNKTRAGGSFFPYLNITIFDLSKYGIFQSADRKIYTHNCLYLALPTRRVIRY